MNRSSNWLVTSLSQVLKREYGIWFWCKVLQEAKDTAHKVGTAAGRKRDVLWETGQRFWVVIESTHHGADQVTMEARCYSFAKRFWSILEVNTVVGFIGPEYLYDSKQSCWFWRRYFMGKLTGISMGCDICYRHMKTPSNDAEKCGSSWAANVNYIMAIPHGDDIMLWTIKLLVIMKLLPRVWSEQTSNQRIWSRMENGIDEGWTSFWNQWRQIYLYETKLVGGIDSEWTRFKRNDPFFVKKRMDTDTVTELKKGRANTKLWI